MKKGSYWFSFLSEVQQRNFRANCKIFYQIMESEEESFYQFILGAFFWEETPEGEWYWALIAKSEVK
jgi:hypothetical protein